MSKSAISRRIREITRKLISSVGIEGYKYVCKGCGCKFDKLEDFYNVWHVKDCPVTLMIRCQFVLCDEIEKPYPLDKLRESVEARRYDLSDIFTSHPVNCLVSKFNTIANELFPGYSELVRSSPMASMVHEATTHLLTHGESVEYDESEEGESESPCEYYIIDNILSEGVLPNE